MIRTKKMVPGGSVSDVKNLTFFEKVKERPQSDKALGSDL